MDIFDLPTGLQIGLLLRSHHFDKEGLGVENENNLGLYLEGDKYAGGGFKNSYGDDSLFFSRKFPTPIKGVDLFGGIASGYEKDRRNTSGFMPMVGGSYTNGNTRVMLTPDLINFGLVFPFK